MKYWWCWNLFRTLKMSPCLQTVAKLPTTAVQRFKNWTSPRLPLSTPPIPAQLKLVQQLGMVGSVGTQGTLARIVPSKNAPQSTINKRKTPFLSTGAVQNTSTFLRMGATGELDVTVSVIGVEIQNDHLCEQIWPWSSASMMAIGFQLLKEIPF